MFKVDGVAKPKEKVRVDRGPNLAAELANIKLVGNWNSAKVEGVIRCLIRIIGQDAAAKCIVFSEHTIVLDFIVQLLQDNFISHKYIKTVHSLRIHIDEFKNAPHINVLVMPYSLGASGLNITEATHVLLVEPTLNKSQEVQAVGRVHRIGQTRPTTVYRFMIRDTIEELVYDMFKQSTSYADVSATANSVAPSTSTGSSEERRRQEQPNKYLTLSDIQNLFASL